MKMFAVANPLPLYEAHRERIGSQHPSPRHHSDSAVSNLTPLYTECGKAPAGATVWYKYGTGASWWLYAEYRKSRSQLRARVITRKSEIIFSASERRSRYKERARAWLGCILGRAGAWP